MFGRDHARKQHATASFARPKTRGAVALSYAIPPAP
ncbi:MAG: CRISPR-associated protein Cas5 [Mesorhizobium sp.]|nr:MAG: CRISPR-associated protein Cas5 [Mesorhizobium sp.]TIP71515.1 MAG: CRISPR-associated protein Cas5 [Mesorhizobium sp.]TIQ14696.1 MAG: CRISPR-associated protein Cas5 [Mesorhizobium sp.]TIQ15372.1 MAG: CRISPR-associated protein Cas5 [Mesorhizobium sp.]TIR52392.1 MAG: CRISPR-associated protein Cas5 [Mesorhizobium sp.]